MRDHLGTRRSWANGANMDRSVELGVLRILVDSIGSITIFLISVMDFKTKTPHTPQGKNRKHKVFAARRKRLWDLRPELDPRLLWLLWLAGVCVVGTSIFATHILSVRFQDGSDEQRDIGTSSRDPQEQLTVTIFTAPAPFEGSVGVQQSIAINSWLRLDPCPRVVLLGRHSSIQAFASNKAPNVTVETDIDATFLGQPLFHGMVQRALSCSTDVVVMVDPDVILLGHVFRALQTIPGLDKDWLLAALPLVVTSFPFSLKGKEFVSFRAHVDEDEVVAYVKDNGFWDTCEGAQFWAWNGNQKPLHAGVMPPFVYREGEHNHWLLTEAISSKYRVVLDASEAFSVFRTERTWKRSDYSYSLSSADKTSGTEWNIGNTWLASTYGTYYFRRLNFSDITLKLLIYGGLRSEKFCMVNTSQHPCFCSSLTPAGTPKKWLTTQEKEYTWPFFYYPPTWASWFEDLVGWTQTESVARSEYLARISTHAHLLSDKKQQQRSSGCNSSPFHQKFHCLDAKQGGSAIVKSELSYSLEWLLSTVASDEKVVILAVVGNSYRDMLMSWVCRLKRLQISNFLVSALDDDIFQFASHQGLPVFRNKVDMNVSRNDCHFGSTCFQRVTKMKSRTVLQILQLGFHVLFSDVDIYWFEDPSRELMSFGPGHFPAQTDQWNVTEPHNVPRRLNSGFYFAWADHRTVAAFENIVKHAATSDMSEQPSFYDVLCGEEGIYRVGNDICIQPLLNLTVHFLDPIKYPNGAFGSLWEKKDVRSACMAQGCKVLHNNWVPGRQRKLDRQIAAGLWEYDEVTRLCLTNSTYNVT